MTTPRLSAIPAYQPTMAVIATILYLTLLPHPLGEEDIQLFEGADKVVHAIMFGGLTGTYIYDRWRSCRPVTLKGALVVALLSAIFGMTVEYLQASMGLGRAGNDIYDALANTIGAFLAVPVTHWLRWTR